MKTEWLSLHIFINILCYENIINMVLSTVRFVPFLDNGMNLNVDKTASISFTSKVNSVTIR